MRWISDRQSVESEQVSMLAIFETAVAVGISITIIIYTKSVTHIAIGAAIAPFLLIRTCNSAELSMKITRWISTPLYDMLNGIESKVYNIRDIIR
jgi:hypothetical protein